MRKSDLGKSRSKKVAEKMVHRQQSEGKNPPAKAGNGDFRRTAAKVNPLNRMSPMRGGIRF